MRASLVWSMIVGVLATTAGCAENPMCTDCGTGGNNPSSASSTTGTGGSGGGTGGATTGTGGAGTGGGTSSSTGTGGSTTCGGKMGLACQPDEFCDYPDDLCGAADGPGTCAPRPLGCPDSYVPICACDGVVHANACDAQMIGLDVSTLGTCTPPAGRFGCGSGFCEQNIEYCEKIIPGIPGAQPSYTCKPVAPKCPVSPTCACLSNEPCGATCGPSKDGQGLMLTCAAP